MNIKLRQILLVLVLILTLTACKDNNKMVVYFDTRGGDVLDEITVDRTNPKILLPTPTYSGYTFLYWAINPHGDEFDMDFSVIEDPELTLYAMWDANTYTITIHPNNVTTDYSLEFDTDEVIAITPPTQYDFVFIGWYLDENLSTMMPAQMPAQDIDVYAKWIPETTYTEDNVIRTHIVTYHDSTLVVDIIIDGNVHFAGYEFEILYNCSNMTLWSYTNILDNVVNTTVDGEITFNYVDALHPKTELQDIITLTFSIDDLDQVDILIVVEDFIDVNDQYQVFDADFTLIPFTTD